MSDLIIVEQPTEISIVTVGGVGPPGPSGGGSGDLSNTAPLMNGAEAPGSALNASRGDHVHPSDTSRAPATHVGAGGAAHADAVAAGAAGFMTGADKTKIDGIAAGATANDTNASLRDRSTHTGTQAASTITGLASVATSGAYADLSGLPTLGSVAALSGPGGTSLFLRADNTYAAPPAAAAPAWGTVTGLLANQTDLQAALDAKASTSSLAAVATSGQYSDLTGKPTLFSGAYADLTGKPTLFSGAYADLTGKPTLGTVAALSYPGGTTLYLRADGTWATPPGGGGSGDVVGPAVAVNNRVAVFDGTTGKLLKDGGVVLGTVAPLSFPSNTTTWLRGDGTFTTVAATTAATLATARTIDGVSFNGSANITVLGPATFAAAAKTTLVDADTTNITDSAASNALKKVTWANIKATLKTYFDTLYAVLASPAFTGTPTAPTATAGANTTQLATTAFVTTAVAAVSGGGPVAWNLQTSNYTLGIGDANNGVAMNIASANNLTIPPNSSVAFPVGTSILIEQEGAGITSFVAGAGVTIRKRSALSLAMAGQYALATIVKRATDEWVLTGDLT